MIDTSITADQFMVEICEFRKLMGNREFMTGTDTPAQNTAIRALQFAFTNVAGTEEEIERCTNIYEATVAEYARRKAMLAVMPLRQALGLPKRLTPRR